MDLASVLSPDTVNVLGAFAPLAVLVGVIFFGEIVILSSFILVGQGYMSIPVVFIVSLVGTLIADFFWFLVGRYVPYIRHTKLFRTIVALYGKRQSFFLRHPFFVLMIINYLYGFRWSTIMYYASTPITFGRYALFDMLGTLAYVAVLAVVGSITGLGIYNLAEKYHTATLVLLTVVAAFLVMALLKFIGRLLFKELFNTSS